MESVLALEPKLKDFPPAVKILPGSPASPESTQYLCNGLFEDITLKYHISLIY